MRSTAPSWGRAPNGRAPGAANPCRRRRARATLPLQGDELSETAALLGADTTRRRARKRASPCAPCATAHGKLASKRSAQPRRGEGRSGCAWSPGFRGAPSTARRGWAGADPQECKRSAQRRQARRRQGWKPAGTRHRRWLDAKHDSPAGAAGTPLGDTRRPAESRGRPSLRMHSASPAQRHDEALWPRTPQVQHPTSRSPM